jgi:MFS family permease
MPMTGKPASRPSIPKVVIVLGFVSLLNDMASDMIAPLLPVVITTVLGGTTLDLGLIEGTAEATSSLLKLFSGWIADRGFGHRRLVLGGYLLSNVARPFIGLVASWHAVLGLRFLDRAGKGIRTAPRDALISASVDASVRGRAFGFHRAMDHTGAIIGPLLMVPLLAAGWQTQHVFIASALPGLAVILLLVFGLKVERAAPVAKVPWPHWRTLDRDLRSLIIAASGLTLSTMPEAFLIVWASRGGIGTIWIPVLWAVAHAIKMGISYGAGVLSDRVGRLPVVIFGWCARVALMVVIALGVSGLVNLCLVFLAYGGALACTEAAERALIGDAAPADQRATAYGLYHVTCSLLALPGAALFGWLWEYASMPVAFFTSAAGTAASALALSMLTRGVKAKSIHQP